MSISAVQFEELVKNILKANQFNLQAVGDANPGAVGFDFTGTLGNEAWAIEVKFYRTARAQVSLLEAAASRLAAQAILAQAGKGMLIVSCQLPPSLRLALEEKFSLTFVDRSDLLVWAAKSPALLDELASLLELDPRLTPDPQGRPVAQTIGASKRLSEVLTPEETKGSELNRELKLLEPGKSAWADYENLSGRILRHLFSSDLYGWHRQKRTDDGLDRYDYVCGIRPTTAFWQFLVQPLNSRYVWFEFNNDSGKLNQGQLLATEQYLSERGLRRVAIVLCRNGAETDAINMTQAAMREQGKLMLMLDDEKIGEMLHMKDRGEDPTDCLFALADDFLLSLPRNYQKRTT